MADWKDDAETLLALDAQDIASLFQDAAGTTPVEDPGDPVRIWTGQAAGADITAPSDGVRGIYRVSDDGAPYVEFVGDTTRYDAPDLDGLLSVGQHEWWVGVAVIPVSAENHGDAGVCLIGEGTDAGSRTATIFWFGHDPGMGDTWFPIIERIYEGSFGTVWKYMDLPADGRGVVIGSYNGSDTLKIELGADSATGSDTRSMGSYNSTGTFIGYHVSNAVSGATVGIARYVVRSEAPTGSTLDDIMDWLEAGLAEPVPDLGFTEGIASITLGAVTTDGEGTADIDGTGAATVGNVSSAGAGNVYITGAGTPALADVFVEGLGVQTNEGRFDTTLGDVSSTGRGAVDTVGEGLLAIGDVTSDGIGGVENLGALSTTLGAVTLKGFGGQIAIGTLNRALDPLGLDASGEVIDPPVGPGPDLLGELAVTLGGLTIKGLGEVTSYADLEGALTVTLGAVTVQGAGYARTQGGGGGAPAPVEAVADVVWRPVYRRPWQPTVNLEK